MCYGGLNHTKVPPGTHSTVTPAKQMTEWFPAPLRELDATLTFALPNGATEVVVFGTNLLARGNLQNGLNLEGSFGVAAQHHNYSRMYRVELRRSF